MKLSKKAWAWEFLRRNDDYRSEYARWKFAVDSSPREDPKRQAKFAALLAATGYRQARYKPWVEAALQSGLPFVLARDPYKTIDPLQYLVRRWVDPDTPSQDI